MVDVRVFDEGALKDVDPWLNIFSRVASSPKVCAVEANNFLDDSDRVSLDKFFGRFGLYVACSKIDPSGYKSRVFVGDWAFARLSARFKTFGKNLDSVTVREYFEVLSWGDTDDIDWDVLNRVLGRHVGDFEVLLRHFDNLLDSHPGVFKADSDVLTSDSLVEIALNKVSASELNGFVNRCCSAPRRDFYNLLSLALSPHFHNYSVFEDKSVFDSVMSAAPIFVDFFVDNPTEFSGYGWDEISSLSLGGFLLGHVPEFKVFLPDVDADRDSHLRLSVFPDCYLLSPDVPVSHFDVQNDGLWGRYYRVGGDAFFDTLVEFGGVDWLADCVGVSLRDKRSFFILAEDVSSRLGFDTSVGPVHAYFGAEYLVRKNFWTVGDVARYVAPSGPVTVSLPSANRVNGVSIVLYRQLVDYFNVSAAHPEIAQSVLASHCEDSTFSEILALLESF